MTKTLSDVLYQILENYFATLSEDELVLIEPSYIVFLDDDRKVKIYLHNTFAADTYDSIFLKLIDKRRGVLDTHVIKFSDVFMYINDMFHPNKIAKHVWKTDGRYEWYGKPTSDDLAKLRSQVEDYIDMWR